MAKGTDVDQKFEQAVDTEMKGGGEEDLDSFLQESFKGASSNEGVADYDEDLGYAVEETETAEQETEAEGEEAEETVDSEEVEEEVDDEQTEAEEVEDSEESEGEDEEEAEEEESDDEPFYDAARDFEGEDVPPTMYKDRMSLNHGLVAKVSYFKTLQERLDEAGTDLGALSLPKAIDGDPGNFGQYSDVEQAMSLPDEQAKEFIKEMDVLLQNMKNKAERFESLQEKEQKKEQLSEEYIEAQQEAQAATRLLDLKVEESMTNREIIDQAYQKLEAFEDDQEQLEELGQKKFLARLREMEDAVFAIEDFAKVAIEQEKMVKEETADQKKVTPEQIRQAFKEFMEDQPNLDMVKNNRVEMQKSLIQTAIRKGWNVESPRDWLNNYQKFMDIVNANRAKKGLKKLKNETKGKTSQSEDKTEEGQQKKTGRAKKYADKKPVTTPGSVSYTNRTANKRVDQIDDEIDQLAAELSEGRDAGDNEFQW